MLFNKKKIQRTEQEILNFMYELASSSDPFILAGFGTENQKKIMNSELDIFDFITNWIEKSNKNALIKTIINILAENKLDENCQHIKKQNKEDWDTAIEDIITKTCDNDKKKILEVAKALEKSHFSKEHARELILSIE